MKEGKAVINRRTLTEIKEAALVEFGNKIPRDLSASDLQKYLLFKGLERYMTSLGIESNFKIEIDSKKGKNYG